MSKYTSEYMSILSENAAADKFYRREDIEQAMRRVGYGTVTTDKVMSALDAGDPGADSFSADAIFSALPYEGGSGAPPDGKGVARRVMSSLTGKEVRVEERPHVAKPLAEVADQSDVVKMLRGRIVDLEKRIAGLEEANAALEEEITYLRNRYGIDTARAYN